ETCPVQVFRYTGVQALDCFDPPELPALRSQPEHLSSFYRRSSAFIGDSKSLFAPPLSDQPPRRNRPDRLHPALAVRDDLVVQVRRPAGVVDDHLHPLADLRLAVTLAEIDVAMLL